ncbi:hypothetical protein D7Y21_16095 [Corallococcus sp. AB045]|nr:hypothetical protein D7Y21_16095 [Corallococcus sp. AB045]
MRRPVLRARESIVFHWPGSASASKLLGLLELEEVGFGLGRLEPLHLGHRVESPNSWARARCLRRVVSRLLTLFLGSPAFTFCALNA